MKISHELTRKIIRRCGYSIAILLTLYLLSVGPVIAVCRQFAASPVGPTPGMYYIGLFYTPLFSIPVLAPLTEFYINLWVKII